MSATDDILYHSDEQLGRELLMWWITLVAEHFDLDLNNAEIQMSIVLRTRSMDDASLINAGYEKAIKKAAQGEYVKAGEMFRALIMSGVNKRIDDWNYQQVLTAGLHFADLHEAKRNQDKRRVENRQDQVDKVEFQKLVKGNINEYKTKADAIRDLRMNDRFSDYPDKTLRAWVSDVWTNPVVNGRPKKAS